MSDEREQRELLATACHILYRLGLSDYVGHPSACPVSERVHRRRRGRRALESDQPVVYHEEGSFEPGSHAHNTASPEGNHLSDPEEHSTLEAVAARSGPLVDIQLPKWLSGQGPGQGG